MDTNVETDEREPVVKAEVEDTASSIWEEMERKEAGLEEPTPEEGRDDAEPAAGDAQPSDEQKAEPAAGEARGNEPDGEAETDEWANAPDNLREQFANLKAENEKLQAGKKSEIGRNAALQRKIARLRRDMEGGGDDAKPQSSKDVLKPIQEEYPDIAAPLGEFADRIDGQITAQDAASQQRREDAQRELNEIVTEQEAELTRSHPDWKDVLNSNQASFGSWVADQPLKIRQAFSVNEHGITDAGAAAELVEAFKTFIAPPEAAAATPPDTKRQRQLAATSQPRKSNGQATVSGIPRDGDPEAIWNAMEAEDEAKKRRRSR